MIYVLRLWQLCRKKAMFKIIWCLFKYFLPEKSDIEAIVAVDGRIRRGCKLIPDPISCAV